MLKGETSSLVTGNLTIGSIASLSSPTEQDNSNLPVSSITFSNLQTQLHLQDGTLTLAPETRLLYEGGLSIFDLEYNKKYPLILTNLDIEDQRSQEHKDIIFLKTPLLESSFEIHTYHQPKEIGLFLTTDKAPIVPPPLPEQIQSNPMFQALTQTNKEQQKEFYSVAFDAITLLAQKGKLQPMKDLLRQAEALASDLSSLAMPTFTLSSTSSQNYAKNLKLYLESKTGFTKPESLSTKLRYRALASYQDHMLYANNTRTDVPTLTDPSFLVFDDLKKELSKQNNLWLSLSGNYAMFDSHSIYGGGISGGYDYLFSNTRNFFASVGFSLNYAYSQYDRLLLTTQSHNLLAGLHSDLIYHNHEWMSHLFVGGIFNSIDTNHSHLATSFEGGFELRNQKLDNQDFLLDLQVLYKYIINLKTSDEGTYQEIKPVVGFEYRYLNLAKSVVDIFKAEEMNLSLPVLKAGVEYGLSSASQIHIFSLLAEYVFNTPKERDFYVGTARYLDHSYIQTKMQDANIQIMYSGSIEVGNNVRVDYSLRSGSSLLRLGYFEVGGNLGVNWKF